MGLVDDYEQTIRSMLPATQVESFLTFDGGGLTSNPAGEMIVASDFCDGDLVLRRSGGEVAALVRGGDRRSCTSTC